MFSTIVIIWQTIAHEITKFSHSLTRIIDEGRVDTLARNFEMTQVIIALCTFSSKLDDSPLAFSQPSFFHKSCENKERKRARVFPTETIETFVDLSSLRAGRRKFRELAS